MNVILNNNVILHRCTFILNEVKDLYASYKNHTSPKKKRSSLARSTLVSNSLLPYHRIQNEYPSPSLRSQFYIQ
jgi:hypothetical protein